MREGAKRSRCRGDGGWWPGCRTVGACLAVCACACLCVSACARRGGGGRGARLDPTIAARYPLPPNPCAPAVSVPVPVPVPVPPRTPLRLPAVNTPLPQVNCAALCKAIQATSGRSPSRPTGTTSCPHRMTRRSGSGTPHRVCLHIRRRAYVACPMFDFLFGNGEGASECAREPSARGAGGTVGGGRAVVPWGRVSRCARVRVCVCLRVHAGAKVGMGRANHRRTLPPPPQPLRPRGVCPSPCPCPCPPTHPPPLAHRQHTSSTGQLRRTLEGHSHYVCAVAIAPNGDYIVSGSYDKTVRIWDSASGMSAHTPARVRGLPGLGLGFERVYVATRACAALLYRRGVSVSVCVWAPGRRWAWGAPTIAEHYPLSPNPCAPAVSVPVTVLVPVPTHPRPLARQKGGVPIKFE